MAGVVFGLSLMIVLYLLLILGALVFLPWASEQERSDRRAVGVVQEEVRQAQQQVQTVVRDAQGQMLGMLIEARLRDRSGR